VLSTGTPQGAPISPLLSNLYMRRFVLGWKQCGHEKRLKARVVVYADDFVILCRGTAMRAKEQMQKIAACTWNAALSTSLTKADCAEPHSKEQKISLSGTRSRRPALT
jgi:retron-type reverse transcriptase